MATYTLDLSNHSVTDCRFNHKITELTLEVSKGDIPTVRQLGETAGSIKVINEYGGGFRAFDETSTGNSVDLEPGDLNPPLDSGIHFVTDYAERPSGQAGVEYEVDIRLHIDRDISLLNNPPTESAGTNEWLLDFESGEIVPDTVRVLDRESQRLSTIECTVSDTQTNAIAANLGRNDGAVEYRVPGGNDWYEDTTTDTRNSLVIEPPTGNEIYPRKKHYIIEEWEARHKTPGFWTVELGLAPVGKRIRRVGGGGGGFATGVTYAGQTGGAYPSNDNET